ncbi:MAG: hypothetical protein QW487_07690 [Candidatus Bathyarchaeia archaeon]
MTLDIEGQHDLKDILIEPILNGKADLAIRSRFLSCEVPKLREIAIKTIRKASIVKKVVKPAFRRLKGKLKMPRFYICLFKSAYLRLFYMNW